MICAMNASGIVLYTVHNQAVNRENFIEFIVELKATLRAKAIARSYFMMDNVAFHQSSSIKEAIANDEDKPLFLPPYSPFLNPIENLFNQWKKRVKRARPNNQEELMEAISNGVSYITAEDCEGYIRNMWVCIRHGQEERES